jgi:hypothetical protein
MAGLTPTRSTNSNVIDYTWLASREGVENTQSATLDGDSLRAAGTHKLENWVKSGTPLGIITAAGAKQGRFGLYDPAATDGRQKHVGFLIAEIQLSDPVTGQNNEPLSGAVLRKGQVIVNRLPVAFDATDADVSPHFIYR